MNLDLGQIAGLLTAGVMALTGIITGVVWIAGIAGKVNKSDAALADHIKRSDAALAEHIKHSEARLHEAKRELNQLESRMLVVEDHKTSVAVLASQMTMVLDRISELSRDVKNLLDGHARRDALDHK